MLFLLIKEIFFVNEKLKSIGFHFTKNQSILLHITNIPFDNFKLYKFSKILYKMIENNINISDYSDSDDEKKKIEICYYCRNYEDESHKLEYSDIEKRYVCDQCNKNNKLISPLAMKMSPHHFLNIEDSKFTIISESRNVKPILKFSVSAILGDNRKQSENIDNSQKNGNYKILLFKLL